jgi:hypothetical protein
MQQKMQTLLKLKLQCALFLISFHANESIMYVIKRLVLTCGAEFLERIVY